MEAMHAYMCVYVWVGRWVCECVNKFQIQLKGYPYPVCLAPRLVQALRSRCLAREIVL